MKKQGKLLSMVQDKSNYGQTMKKNEELQNEIHFAISRKPFLNRHGSGVYARVGKYMKIFSYLILLSGFGIVFNSCMGGYVASEPSYSDYARPQQPSSTHIWIDGDWGWNSQSHVYVQKAGYWDRPRQGHSYVAGHWQSSPRGKSWSRGHWQRDNQHRNDNRDNRDNRDNYNR